MKIKYIVLMGGLLVGIAIFAFMVAPKNVEPEDKGLVVGSVPPEVENQIMLNVNAIKYLFSTSTPMIVGAINANTGLIREQESKIKQLEDSINNLNEKYEDIANRE